MRQNYTWEVERIMINESSMIFDSHAHYDDGAYASDRDALIASLPLKGVEYVVNVGSSIRSLSWVMNMVNKHKLVYGAIGIHPDDSKDLNDEIFERMVRLCDHEKIVAVGEIGLDYYWDATPHEVQKYWFRRQIALAKEKNLPVIIHSREATEDTFNLLKEEKAEEVGGVIHCFSASSEMAKRYVDLGYYIGVGGVVTFKNGKKLKEVVEAIPLESILLETDCPYLAPTPFRGKRNDSSLIKYIAEEVANIKGVTIEEVLRVTNGNAKRMFGI